MISEPTMSEPAATTTSPARIGLVTSSRFPEGDEDAEGLLEALYARGTSPGIVAWDDPAVRWNEFDVIVLAWTWDYTDRLEEFLAWHERTRVLTTVLNDAHLAWNHDKRYLLELAAKGIRIPASSAGTLRELTERSAGHANIQPPFTGPAVLKPAIGAGGHNALAVSGFNAWASEASLETLTDPQTWILQSFEPTITTAGEVSVIALDGTISHAIRKLPRDGEFRIHEHFGGTARGIPVSDDHRRFAEQVLGVLDDVPSYARIDLVERTVGSPVLMELELIEPDLYIRLSPSPETTFARYANTILAAAQPPQR